DITLTGTSGITLTDYIDAASYTTLNPSATTTTLANTAGNDVRIRTNGGTIQIGAVVTSQNDGLEVDSSGGTITLYGSITTGTQAGVTLTGPVVLANTISITTAGNN